MSEFKSISTMYTDVCDETDLELLFEDRMFAGEPVIELNMYNPSTEEGTGMWLSKSSVEKLVQDLTHVLDKVKLLEDK